MGFGRDREGEPSESERDPCWDCRFYSRVVRVSDSFLGEVGGRQGGAGSLQGLGACRGCCGCQAGMLATRTRRWRLRWKEGVRC